MIADSPARARRVLLAAEGAAVAAGVSFEQIYDEHVEFIWRSAHRLGVHDAAIDDVVQHVFIVVHRRLAEFEGRSSMKTWLFAILLRVVREHRRALKRKSPHWHEEAALGEAAFGDVADIESVVDPSEGPEDAACRREASRLIDRLLDALDDDKRVVFVMIELEQMTALEVSEATGLNVKSVYSRLRAARTDFERAAQRVRRQEGTRSHR